MPSAYAVFNRNTVPASNVYPLSGGSTTGQRAGAGTPATAGGTNPAGSPTASAEKASFAPSRIRGPLGQPLTWWLVVAGALVGLMLLAQRIGDDGEFGNIRMSVYNVVIISLAAIIGIAFWKVVFTRFPVPGLSDLVSAV